MNKYEETKVKKEKSLLKRLKKLVNENNTYADLKNVGAYIVFEHLKDKVKCHNTF